MISVDVIVGGVRQRFVIDPDAPSRRVLNAICLALWGTRQTRSHRRTATEEKMHRAHQEFRRSCFLPTSYLGAKR